MSPAEHAQKIVGIFSNHHVTSDPLRGDLEHYVQGYLTDNFFQPSEIAVNPVLPPGPAHGSLVIEPEWTFDQGQSITIHGRKYDIHAAILASQKLEIKETLLSELYIAYCAPCQDNFRSFVAHCRMVREADLSYPIIMNQDGSIIDGRHRVARAILEGHQTIKTRRFPVDPAAIYTCV
jgi:hypothetical protein